ncbi:MAG: DUF4868 domain-containing protein [Bacteroidales bacterium]|jgi:hypothetical protein|nr:DUF4868 domain-containing protein [Bacteroidales bacterium]
MLREEIIEQLSEINNNDNAVEIYVLAQPELDAGNISVDFYKARLHQNLPASIKNLFYPVIERKLIRKEYDILGYDPSVTPDRNVIWEQNSDNVPFYNYFHKLIETKNEIEWYDSETLPYEDIWAYWIKVYGNGNTFYLIKKVTSSKIIKTGGKLAIVFDADVFKSLDNDVLTMDGTFDALYCNNHLIFENKQNFENALLYQEVKQTVAEETLAEIEEIGFVENFDHMKEFLKDDYHSINKLNRIKEKPYFRTLTFAVCHRIIKEYGVDVEIDETNNKFNITSKAQAKHFIKVLNDDYLKSEMTDYKYAANSKEGI